MFKSAIQNAANILDDLIESEDELYLVLDVFWEKNYAKTGILTHYVRNKSLKYKATSEQYEEDDTSWTRLSVPCKKADLKMGKLVAAACHEDFPDRTPRFTRSYKTRYPDLYLINKTQHIVAFIYDDRGMEVVSKELESLLSVAEKHKDILQYSRPFNLK